MTPAPFSHYPTVLALFREVVLRRLQHPAVLPVATPCKTKLLTLISGNRLTMVAGVHDLTGIWNELRADTPALDLLLDITVEFRLALSMSLVTVDDLIGKLADVYGVGERRFDGSTVACDEGFFARLPRSKKLKELMDANPWLITLYMLQQNPLILAEKAA